MAFCIRMTLPKESETTEKAPSGDAIIECPTLLRSHKPNLQFSFSAKSLEDSLGLSEATAFLPPNPNQSLKEYRKVIKFNCCFSTLLFWVFVGNLRQICSDTSFYFICYGQGNVGEHGITATLQCVVEAHKRSFSARHNHVCLRWS